MKQAGDVGRAEDTVGAIDQQIQEQSHIGGRKATHP